MSSSIPRWQGGSTPFSSNGQAGGYGLSAGGAWPIPINVHSDVPGMTSFNGIPIHHQGPFQSDSGANGINTYVMAVDHQHGNDKKAAELDRFPGDACFARTITRNADPMVRGSLPIAISEVKSVSRWNMYMKSDVGRREFAGNNANEVTKELRFIGFQGNGEVAVRGHNTFSMKGRVRTRAIAPYTSDFLGIYLLLVKRRLSQLQVGGGDSYAVTQITPPPKNHETKMLGEDIGLPGKDRNTGIEIFKKTRTLLDAAPPITRLTPYQRAQVESRAMVSGATQQLQQMNNPDPDPLVWQFIPWTGQQKQIPHPANYMAEDGSWIGGYIYLGMHWHYETGTNNPAALPAIHNEFYSPNDTTERFREIGREIPDVEMQAGLF